VRHISAAVLALIDDRHPRLDEFWDVWAEAVKAAFHSGEYDRQREITALNSLLKCRMKNPIAFHRRYPLLILSATKNRLPSDLERTMLEHVIRSPTGIGYTFEKDISVFPSISSRHFWYWVSAHRLLSRFPLCEQMYVDTLNWIWAHRTEEGYWDIGGRIGRKPYSCFPLSESWRRPANRIIDSAVEMLALLQKGCG